MAYSFFISFSAICRNKNTVSIKNFDKAADLVGAVYAWQQTYIENFQRLHDRANIWQTVEQKIKRHGALLEIDVYAISSTLDDSPAVLSQIITALWEAIHHIYNVNIVKVVFNLDSSECQSISSLSPSFSKYHASYQWMRIYETCIGTPLRIQDVSDISSSTTIANETAKFIKSCGIPIMRTAPIFPDVAQKRCGKISTDHYELSNMPWKAFLVGWLLSCVTGMYLPHVHKNFIVSIDVMNFSNSTSPNCSNSG